MSWFQPSTLFQTAESKHTLSDFNPHDADKFYPQSKVPQDFKIRTEALVSLLNALEDIYRQNQAQIPFEKDEQNGKIFASKNEKNRLQRLGNRLSQRVDEALLLEKRGEPEDFHQDADSINVDKNLTESLVTLREKYATISPP
jgi:hypothetical protein